MGGDNSKASAPAPSNPTMGTVTVAGCGACGSQDTWGPGVCSGLGQGWIYDGGNGCGSCGLGGTAVAGMQVKCKYSSYSGSPQSCCTNDNKNGCDPSWVPSNSACSSTMQNYCSMQEIRTPLGVLPGTDPISDPKCQEWMGAQPTVADPIWVSYCANKLDKQECKDWCSSQTGGQCDTIVTNWCKTNPSDPYCACINSSVQDPKYGINPKCVDANCIKSGFITQNMRITACPDLTNCDVQAKVINSGISMANIQISPNCGNKNNNNTSTTAIGSTSVTNSTNSYNNPQVTTNSQLGVLGTMKLKYQQLPTQEKYEVVGSILSIILLILLILFL